MASIRRARLASLQRKAGDGLAPDRPVHEQREAFARLLELTQVGMPDHEVEAVELGGVAALRLIPEQRSPAQPLGDRQLVFVHGGAYSLGSPSTHRPLVARIARALAIEALVPEYRLAPEHPCPHGLDDVLAVWRALPEQVRTRAILAGDSAGGGLALALTMSLRDAGEPLPAGLVLLSPWTDLTVSGESVDALAEHEIMLGRAGLELMAGRYAATLGAGDPRVSPLFGELAGLPPMLVQVGGHEVLLDDSRRLAARAEQAGVAVTLQIWADERHVFQAMPFSSAAAEAMAAMAVWVDGLNATVGP